MTPAHDPRGPLTVLSTPSEGASTVDHPARTGPACSRSPTPTMARAPGTSPLCGGSPEPGARRARC